MDNIRLLLGIKKKDKKPNLLELLVWHGVGD